MKKFIGFVLITFTLISCSGGGSNKSSDEKFTVTAAGATFPLPFYNLAFRKYSETNNVEFNYGGIGSGGGIRSLADKVVDFGATDAFLSEKELKDFTEEIVHIPTCLGAVVIAYNLPGVDSLKLTPQLLEGIFLGSITQWNDPRLGEMNPGIKLPDLNITVVYRSDGSGTTYIFSDYMTKVSSLWADKVGAGKALNWPVGIGAKGNPGVAGTISQTQGTIGYIGSEYAFAQKISYAKIQNRSGNFIEPNIKSVSAAARTDIPADTRIMVTDSSDPEAYPISGFTWIILYKEQSYNDRNENQAKAVVTFLEWLTAGNGQALAESVSYSPLPDNAKAAATALLGTITFDGTSLKE